MSELRMGKSHKQIKRTCIDCGETRWAQAVNPQNGGRPRYKRCHPCAIKWAYVSGKTTRPIGEKSAHWKGGAFIRRGYRWIWLPQDSPWYSMTNGNVYIMEHRLVMAKHLGRTLASNEIVHHVNGDRLDNRIGNLMLLERNKHHALLLNEVLQKRIRELEEKIRTLEDTGNSLFDEVCENNTTKEEE